MIEDHPESSEDNTAEQLPGTKRCIAVSQDHDQHRDRTLGEERDEHRLRNVDEIPKNASCPCRSPEPSTSR